MGAESNGFILIYSFSIIGLIYAAYNVYKVLKVQLQPIEPEEENTFNNNEELPLNRDKIKLSKENIQMMELISRKIAEGADVFLYREYLIILIFIAVFSLLIFFLAEQSIGYFYTTTAFLIGSLTSLLAGFIGMKIATKTNYRTTYKAWYIFTNNF